MLTAQTAGLKAQATSLAKEGPFDGLFEISAAEGFQPAGQKIENLQMKNSSVAHECCTHSYFENSPYLEKECLSLSVQGAQKEIYEQLLVFVSLAFQLHSTITL